MNQSEKHNYEEEWQRMFESEAQTPPSSAWEAIERRLDGENTPIVPLPWWKNPRIAYAAAAVVLLLLSWPILQLTTVPDSDETRIASDSQSTTTRPSPAEQPLGNQSDQALDSEGIQSRQAAPTLTQNNPRDLPPPTRQNTPAIDPAGAIGREIASSGERSGDAGVGGTGKTGQNEASNAAGALPESQLFSRSTRVAKSNDPQEVGPANNNSSDGKLTDSQPALSMSLASLSPIGPSELDVHVQKRYVFYKYDAPTLEPAPSHNREYWAGVGLMPASFNPQVDITTPPAAFSQANASRQALSNSSQAGLSYALQMQTGMRISKHWSIETGLSYLQGNSTFVSEGYVMDAASSRSANVLENALAASNNNQDFSNPGLQPSFAPDPSKVAALYIDLDQRVSNDYRFVQLPAQAGYIINPDGKMNYTVLGGMVANLFLSNELESAAGTTFTNTAEDGIYRPLHWSASTGLRVSYRLSSHWNANLTGSYQRSLTSSLRDNSSMETRPLLYGVSWGVRYIF